MIYKKIQSERNRQNELHPNFPEALRLAVLVEEVGEVGKALQDGKGLEDELIQVSAVAVRWLEELRGTE